MRACVVLHDTGVIVDCVILRRLEAEDVFQQGTGTVPYNSDVGTMHTVTSSMGKFRPTSPLLSEQSMLLSNVSTPRARSPRTTPRLLLRGASSVGNSNPPPLYYVVRTSLHPHRDVVAHAMDIVPFGFHAPSEVFAVQGRHLNKGSALMVLDDGSVLLEKYPTRATAMTSVVETTLAFLLPTPPALLLSTLGARQEKTRQARAEREGGPLSAVAAAIASAKAKQSVVTHTMSEVQLLPMLSADKPTPPLCVGSSVKVRRRGDATRLFMGVVLSARYNCTYSVRYDGDKEVEHGILHNDVLLVSAAGAEDVGVRDKVTFAVLRKGVLVHGSGVVAVAQGEGHYVVYGNLVSPDDDGVGIWNHKGGGNGENAAVHSGSDSDDNPHHSLEDAQRQAVQPFLMHRQNIVHVAPKYLEALHSEHADALLPLFRALDEEGTGTVPWVSVVRFFSQSEYAGQPLTPTDWNRLHHEIVAMHSTITVTDTHRGGMSMVDAAVLDTSLTYGEFEFVANRILNMKW